jgi:hypothetical protein
VDLNKMFNENNEPFTEYEQYLMSKYDVELVFPGGIEVVQKKKAEVLADIVYKHLGAENSKKLVEMLEEQ